MEKLLFEIGTEEIPAKFMPAILSQLETMAKDKLKELRIPFTEVKTYGTPRRMAFLVEGVPKVQEDSTVESKGPSLKIAFGEDGKPSKAAMGFARGQGVNVEDLEKRGEYVFAVKHLKGEAVCDLLPGMLDSIIHSLSFPKNMRWADYDFRFVRPIRWLVALLGKEVIPVEICDVKSGNKTRGHRFMSKGDVVIPTAEDYVKVLEENFVMVDQDKRKELIRKQVEDLAVSEGGVANIDEDLLDEVTYLVEYPTALCGHFDVKYLKLPKEAVITPMRDHQRYFPVITKEGKLLAKFITVRNGGKEHLEVVAHGNERVLRARLSDAEFFFNEDRKVSLENRREKLKTVVFQEGLGNVFDKSERLANIAEGLQKALNIKTNTDNLIKTAKLCKADLVTGMVTEFTELQGVMGREYALLDKEPEEVAIGIYEHYLPRFAGDELPKTAIGRLVGLADKMDNIMATFSRGLAPTGSQDPYALRRQALGVLNILLDAGYHMSLGKALAGAALLLKVEPDKAKKLVPEVLEFFKQRFKNMLIDQNIRYDVIDAVFAEERNDDVVDLYQRAVALNDFVTKKESEDLIQASTRVNNLCKKIEEETAINESLFKEQVEKDLYAALKALDKEIIPEAVTYNYAGVLKLSEGIVAPVNGFLDGVMVMDEDPKVKGNRLALLNAVKGIVNAVGDLSLIVS